MQRLEIVKGTINEFFQNFPPFKTIEQVTEDIYDRCSEDIQHVHVIVRDTHTYYVKFVDLYGLEYVGMVTEFDDRTCSGQRCVHIRAFNRLAVEYLHESDNAFAEIKGGVYFEITR